MTALPPSPRLAHTRKAETGQSPPGGRPFLPSRTPGNRSGSGVKRGEQAKRSEEVRGGPAGAHTPGAGPPSHTPEVGLAAGPRGRGHSRSSALMISPANGLNTSQSAMKSPQPLRGASDKDDGVGGSGVGGQGTDTRAHLPGPRLPWALVGGGRRLPLPRGRAAPRTICQNL